ncbi:hypothetical protein TVAG_078530 [Trichomonas vaginalis G3]|uniref:Uncharacterized protein n=1 Tax=Trichomonas vaginalis (strain ATCC PRA-98 / G3) TaxID=412133 RepID=A2FIU9_TRIV3|nr:Rab GTPase binding [Trichomonas vaginalis G3]EAX95164.1 hypothetical protein TVAG_078530 [Trichomonas vaginalis G3]KAI5514514.1 Rab GTPase binding [Trichomonas vaginalis G3]|eukprot:XP_001308094.1 hypothetical protein [Trichomonas vaginalis G3]
MLQESKYTDSDPIFRIKNLDTGEIIRLDEFIDKYEPEYNSNLKSQNKLELPKNLEFKSFIKEKKSHFYQNIHIQTYKKYLSSEIQCLNVSSDSQYAAVGYSDGEILILDTKTLDVLKKFSDHKNAISTLKFGPDNMLVSCSEDNSIKIWDLASERSIFSYNSNDKITDCCFHPTDPSVILFSTGNNMIHLLNCQTNIILQELSYITPPTAITFSPDGELIIVGCQNGFCYVYSYPDLRYISQFVAGPRAKSEAPNEKVTSISFIGSNNFLVSTNDSRIRLVSADNFTIVRKYIGHCCKNGNMKLSVSKDENLFLIPSEDNNGVFLWPVNHEKYYKSEAIFHSFMKDRSKTAEGFSFGKEIKIKAAAFAHNSSISHLFVIVADSLGGISIIVGQ